MKVLIIGASGLVGSNCLKHFKANGLDVKGTYFSYPQEGLVYFNTLDLNDIKNYNILEWEPNVVVHCGALTHVDYCETNPDESFIQTVQSTFNLISLFKNTATRFVYLSTDYVFDGKNGPYQEHAQLKPLSIYAKHKLQAEQAVINELSNSLVLRVTNIYGDEARGKNFVARIVQQCKEGKKLVLKLPTDQYASPTNALDIAKAMYLLIKDHKKGVYHIGGTDYMNRVQLALGILKHYPDAQYQLEPMTTTELAQPAPRPLLGGFISAKFLSEYPDFLFSTLDDYLRRYNTEK